VASGISRDQRQGHLERKARAVSFNIVRILKQDGFVAIKDNLIDAEKAFFAARVVAWIRECATANKDFNIATYLTMLSYYKLGLADLKFSEDGDKLLYRMKAGEEVDKVVETITRSSPESFRDPEDDPNNCQPT
tara:strand:- start:58892 stop:59293 length:402 start_codon:yes stop_codon:yes gene_type:complete